MTISDNWERAISRPQFIALVAAIMALNAMAIDIMLPAFPEITSALRVDDPNHTQFVLTAYFVGFGIGQLALGPISDRFGRRAPLLWGLSLYIVAALAAAFSPSFAVLLALRVTQGLGAAATRIVAIAVIRDTHSGRAMAEVMSLVFMIFMIVPIIAPAIGQILVLFGPWNLIFVVMAVMGLAVMVWSFFRLPETLKESNQRPLGFGSVVEGFRLVFSNRAAMMYGVAPAVMFGALFAFISTVQPIYTEIYDLGALFPFAFAAMAGSMAISSLLNARIVRIFGMRRLSQGALCGFIFISAIWYFWSLAGVIPLPAFIAIIASVMVMFGMIANNFNSLAMEPLGKVAGTASSVFGFMQTFGGAVVGAFIGQYYDGTTTPIALGYLVLAIGSMIMVLIAEDGKLFRVVNEDPAKAP
jgi:DHA1 family bicyclomycin/chloramphenicol resistance-like MFS transporter